MRTSKANLNQILRIALPKYCKGKAVDVGAGYGKYKGLILEHAESYVSVDDMSSEYQYNDSYKKPDIVSNALNIPVSDGEFDTVICTEVLEHVEDPFKLFSELSRILKPGGYALVSSGWIAAHHEEPKDYWRFSLDAYKVLCKRSGLDFIESYRKGGLFTVFLYLITRNIVLRLKPSSLRVRVWNKINPPLTLIAERMDGLVKTEDTVGHLVVAQKPLA